MPMKVIQRAAPFTRSPVMNPISITKASSPMDIGSRNTGKHLKPFIGDVVYQYYNDGAYHQEDACARVIGPQWSPLL